MKKLEEIVRTGDLILHNYYPKGLIEQHYDLIKIDKEEGIYYFRHQKIQNEKIIGFRRLDGIFYTPILEIFGDDREDNTSCKYVEDIVKEHKIIAKRHLPDHKFFQHIANNEEAMIHFINQFGWIIREVYCDKCSESPTCDSYQTYLKNEGWKRYE